MLASKNLFWLSWAEGGTGSCLKWFAVAEPPGSVSCRELTEFSREYLLLMLRDWRVTRLVFGLFAVRVCPSGRLHF